jgi:hypothetical protein
MLRVSSHRQILQHSQTQGCAGYRALRNKVQLSLVKGIMTTVVGTTFVSRCGASVVQLPPHPGLLPRDITLVTVLFFVISEFIFLWNAGVLRLAEARGYHRI